MEGTGFLPSRDGFPFRNDFDYPATRLGRSAPLAPGFGLAGGMCLSALDRWQAGRPLPVPPGAPEPGDVLYEELARRQVELLNHGAWDRILEWQRRPGVGGFVGERGVGELTRLEWRRARRSLERGMPVLLCVLRTRGPFANPSENPFVLAYRYEFASDTKRGTFWVYDPNRPGNDDVRLTIVPGGRRRAPEVTFISERVRGFFVLPYDRPSAAPLRATEMTEASAGGMNGRAAALPGAGANAIVRARNGGFVVVRAAKPDVEARAQRIEGDVLASDPIVIGGRIPTILSRAQDGTVLGFRRGVTGWRGRPMPSAKTPLSLDFGPTVVSSRGRVHAFGVKDGRLAHMQRSPAGMWSAGIVTAQTGAGSSERLEGTPSAVVDGGRVIRVFTRTEGGRIAHMALTPDGRWSATLLPVADGAIAGDALAVIAPGDDQITVFAVSDQGELIQLRGGADAWRARNLTRETSHDGGPYAVRVEIAVSAGPGNTLHVFGVSPRNGLIHYWCPPTLAWRAQDLTHGRVETGDAARVRGRPSVVRTADDQLVVAAAAERGIVVYRWNSAGDWTGDALPMPDGFAQRLSPEGPTVWRDARGQAYLHATFDDGRAILAVPGRPDTAQRTTRIEQGRSVPRARPTRAERQTEGRRTDAGVPVGVTPPAVSPTVAIAAGAEVEPPAEQASPIDLDTVDFGALSSGGTGANDAMSLDSFGSMDLSQLQLGGADASVGDDAPSLLDLGSMSMDAATAGEVAPGLELGREGWDGHAAEKPGSDAGSTAAEGGFQPAAPLMPDANAASRPLVEDFTLPGTAENTRREEDRARRKAEEKERAREKAETGSRQKAELEERARLKAEQEEQARQQAEREERARLEAEAETRREAEAVARRKAAEEEERARKKAEAEAKKKAEEEERARKKAEAEARKKAEEQERARLKAEEEARLAAEEAARVAAAEEARKAEEAERAAAARRRSIPAALEGLPLLDDKVTPRDRVATEDAKPVPAPKPKDSGRPKPKLRSIDDLIRLADDHDPTFEKK